MRHRWALVVALGVLVVLLGPSRSASGLPSLTGTRVAYNGDLGDPFVLVVGGSYVAYGTGDWPARVPTATTPDLVHWQAGPDAMPALPAWASIDPTNSFSWAPAVIPAGGRFVLYISLQEAATRRECVAVATSSSPTGPFRDPRGGPLVCQHDLGGSIDPSVVRDDHGGLHLLWKSDGNCCGIPVGLWVQDLRPDGLATAGAPHRLLGADQPWQGGVIENPAMLRDAAGGWWLFYSGNVWDTAAYGTGIAWCRALEGPCTDEGRFLSTAAGQFSPGGVETFRDLRGATRIVFATWNRPSRHGRFYCCRSLDLATVR